MTPALVECAHEADVVEAVAFGIWEPGLRDHVSECETCAEVAGIARALHDDRAAGCQEAHVPAAGMVWWRSTIRARAEATHTVAQPITLLQGIAGACAMGLGVSLLGIAWRALPDMGDVATAASLVERLEAGRAQIAAASSMIPAFGLALVLGVAACLVLAPIAFYFTLGDE